MTESLEQIHNRYKRVVNGLEWPDKNSTHSYLPVYEQILEPYRKSAKNILEIGLMSGDSLRMWHDYFDAPHRIVFGVDCSETPHDGLADLRPMIAEHWPISIFDATNADEAKKYFGHIKFDVIIEDAGHSIEQQLQLFKIWKEYLNKGFHKPRPIYIIEDVQNIDEDRDKLLNLEGAGMFKVEIIDRRSVKGRYDDVMVIIK